MSEWPENLDAMKAAPEHHKVLFENEHVRVIETLIPPGETTKVHTHCWSGALLIRSWTDFIRYDADGRELFDSRSVDPRPIDGTITWSPPLGPHYVTNIGSENLHVIATELKDVP